MIPELKQDLKPKSAEHVIRLVLGSLMVIGGLVAAILHYRGPNPWSLYEVILTLGLVMGGMGFLFTTTALELVKAFPWPWKHQHPDA